MQYPYTLREPITSDVNREGRIISRHRTVEGARRALSRRQDAAARKGGYSRAYVHDDRAVALVYETPCPGCKAIHTWEHADGCRWYTPVSDRWVLLDG